MDKAGFEPLVEIEVEEVWPAPTGFMLLGRGSDGVEYRAGLRLGMPLDGRTRQVLGELLTQADLTLARRVSGPPPQPRRSRRQRARP